MTNRTARTTPRAWRPAGVRALSDGTARVDDQAPSVWRFGLRTVSPLFLGGAEPNERGEVRLPSVRGALRSWYRVLVGPETAAGWAGEGREFPPESEQALFGGTVAGQGLVTVSLEGEVPDGTERWNRRSVGPGVGYLGYSLGLGSNDRKAVPAGTDFTVRAVHPRGLSADAAHRLMACWWTLVHLGGLGSRSRRGFGSLEATDWPTGATDLRGEALAGAFPGTDNPCMATSYREVAVALLEGLGTLHDWGLGRAPATGADADGPTPEPAYHLVLDPETPDRDRSRVVVVGPGGDRGWPDWRKALEHVGLALSAFRKERGVDGWDRSTLAALQRGERLAHAPHRTAFGLPLTYRPAPRKPGKSFELQPYLGQAGQAARVPSPLLIHLVRCHAGVFAVLTRLSGRLPGRDVAVAVKGQERGYMRPAPDNRVLDAFLDSLPDRKEVRL